MGFPKSIFIFLLSLQSSSAASSINSIQNTSNPIFHRNLSPCQGARAHRGYPDSCSYAIAHPDCQLGALFQYIQIFYCNSSSITTQVLCFIAISLWLAALFYMLGNTAADYFCSCLQRLSQILRLPPTVAGVTLLPLGNGAPDVFASVVSFLGPQQGGEVGLNSLLGGAVFVVTVVAGMVNILVAGRDIRLDGMCFLRDSIFFLVSLGCLMGVLWRGRISVLEAVGYLGLYLVYAIVVVVWEIVRARAASKSKFDEESVRPLLDEKRQDGRLEGMVTVPEWLWASHLTIYSNQSRSFGDRIDEIKNPDKSPRKCSESQTNAVERQLDPEENLNRGSGDQQNAEDAADPDDNKSSPEAKITRSKSFFNLSRKASHLLIKVPLGLPRQLTIPDVDESRWSRPRATIAATLAPILLVAVWSAENGSPLTNDLGFLAAGTMIGIVLGITAFRTTVSEQPPQGKLQLVWVIAGFVMSMAWFYVIARELVGALVSIAAVLGIDAAILGLTVLAWGNSMGDMVANTTMATRGGTAGVQIAVSGCYASPMFNTLFGLGVSLLIATVRSEGKVYRIAGAGMGFVTVGFLAAAIVAAMVMFAVGGMRCSKAFGVGLICFYVVFLLMRGSDTLGLI